MDFGYVETLLILSKPNDPVKQSFPFIYISVEAKSTDGKPHNVQMYFDISAGLWFVATDSRIKPDTRVC